MNLEWALGMDKGSHVFRPTTALTFTDFEWRVPTQYPMIHSNVNLVIGDHIDENVPIW